jgi:hypothetical protein
MHERILTAYRPMACDLCGQMIRPGERYRAVRDEYSLVEYREHIQCPGASAVAITDPRPRPPKIRTAFNNHALCMA